MFDTPPSGGAGTPHDAKAVDVLADLADRGMTEHSVTEICVALGVTAPGVRICEQFAVDYLNPDARQRLYSYLDVMIAERCTSPREDLLCDLIAHEVNGEGLTVDDLHAVVAVLLAGAELGAGAGRPGSLPHGPSRSVPRSLPKSR